MSMPAGFNPAERPPYVRTRQRGALVATWQRLERLTVTGQGEVYWVRNKESGQLAIMKRLVKARQLDSGGEIRRFRREAAVSYRRVMGKSGSCAKMAGFLAGVNRQSAVAGRRDDPPRISGSFTPRQTHEFDPAAPTGSNAVGGPLVWVRGRWRGERTMQAPSDDLRTQVALTTEDWAASDLPDEVHEDFLDDLLSHLEAEMDGALGDEPSREDMTVEQAEEQLSAVDSWAGLISHAVGRVYAPASPWPRRTAGWAQKVVRRLRRMANKLKATLAPVAKALGAVHFSISVSFPWGISIGVSF